MGLTLKIFYRKIYINGACKLKDGQAYILASNHPAGFVEPLIMACYFPRDLYFLTRGDLFANKIYNYVFTATHQIPIFRFVDGFSSLRNNQQSVGKAIQTLKEKKALLVFAEGNTSYCFNARPLQKGFARIGFQALTEDPSLDIKVMPIGISFNNVDKMGSDVILNVGDPIDLKTYFDTEPSKAASGMNDLLRDTHLQMKQLMLVDDDTMPIIDIRKAWSSAAKDDNLIFPKVVRDTDFFSKIKEDLANKRNQTNNDHLPIINGNKNTFLPFLWPLAIPSLIFTFVPRLLSSFYKNKKVKKLEFKMPVALAVGLISYLIMMILFLVIFSFIFGFIKALGLLILILLSGLVHVLVWENSFKKVNGKS
jgi:1-acyl-sn-glycerol-3-phosphate acyltransferase